MRSLHPGNDGEGLTKILPTILSRCQIFDFKRITASDTVEHLEGYRRDEEGIHAEKRRPCS